MPGRVYSVPPDADPAMATHDDTIVLDASPITAAPRVKRVKTEHAGASPAPSLDTSHHAAWPSSIPTPTSADSPAPHPLPLEHHHQHHHLLQQHSDRPLAPDSTPVLPSSPAELASEGPTLRKIKTPSLRLRLAQASQPESRSPRSSQISKQRLIDFSSAPIDPAEFVWWLTKHVTSVPLPAALNGPGSLPGFDSMTSVMRPLNMLSPGPEPNSNVMREKEREKQRVDNRERKKRWRETNSERNKDNDLRCRVTKLAKTKFGADDSPEKAAFIEHEFESRRAKRAEKEKRLPTYRGVISAFRPGSNTARDLKEHLRLRLKMSIKPDAEYVGSQLVELLVDAAGRQLSETSIEIARLLRKDIASGVATVADLDDAARILADNEELRRALETGIDDGKDSAEPDSIEDDDEEEFAIGNGHWTKDTTPANHSDILEDATAESKPVDPTENLSRAVQTLNGMSKVQKPGRQSTRPTRGRGRTGRGRKGKKAQRATTKPSATTHSMETSSIDALLALANGGSIMYNDDDDDDEETIPDPEELIAEDLNFVDTTADTYLNVILERVATRIVTERLENEGFRARSGSVLAFDADAYRTHAVREQVLSLKTFLSEAGVSVNTLMPLAQAQALSELYAQLLRYIERESALPDRASASSNAVDGEQSAWNTSGQSQDASRLLAEASDHPFRSVEEQRKIATYGYPPLPGKFFSARGDKTT